MRSRLVHGCAIYAVICGVLFLAGLSMASRIQITTRVEKRNVDVVITLPNVAATWISVYACTAEFSPDARVLCDGFWERESGQEARPDQRQYIFPWRSVPRGTIQITAMAFDNNHKTLATGQTVVFTR